MNNDQGSPNASHVDPGELAERERRFPIGAGVTPETLTQAPYDLLARLREHEPVSWIPALGGWFITRRDLGLVAMRDAETFTVDDSRFTTAAVIGPSMLSLEGDEHERHRSAFADHFRLNRVNEGFTDPLGDQARRLVAALGNDSSASNTVELRTALAGPMAVETITAFLGLEGVDSARMLQWYRRLADDIVEVTLGQPVEPGGSPVLAEIRDRVIKTQELGTSALLTDLAENSRLEAAEIPTAVAVVMFGAIETSEGMTANSLWHLLTNPDIWNRVVDDRSLVAPAIEESLRMEPAAAVIDRYTTRPTELGGVTIGERELVTISLLGSNRDPEVFEQPDRYDIDRPNLRQHVTFVKGPHNCLGLHLARLETTAAINAVMDAAPDLTLVAEQSVPAEGLIFRKPAAVTVNWPPFPR